MTVHTLPRLASNHASAVGQYDIAIGLAFPSESDSKNLMPRQRIPSLKDIKRTELSAMSRVEIEELTWGLHELTRTLANRAGEDSTISFPPAFERHSLSA